MGLDSSYRPTRYSDVVGQEHITRVLVEYVKQGRGYHQSYLFAGPFGSGKTTIARILARALLCHDPQGGEPCDRCSSCLEILEHNSSEAYLEYDAATHSGKESIKTILESLEYSMFSATRRICLMDEAHRLSKEAMDALLKPMEDEIPGTSDKQLVCIFCTTEPNKVRRTIMTRCAPTFVIRKPSPSDIAGRLSFVCEQEGFGFDAEALELLAVATECHLRDALKGIESLSLLGKITEESVRAEFNLESFADCGRALLDLKGDVARGVKTIEQVSGLIGPGETSKILAEVCVSAYRSGFGSTNPVHRWAADLLKELHDTFGASLLWMADRFSRRPMISGVSSLVCDFMSITAVNSGGLESPVISAPVVAQVVQPVVGPPPVNLEQKNKRASEVVESKSPEKVASKASGRKSKSKLDSKKAQNKLKKDDPNRVRLEHGIYINPDSIRNGACGQVPVRPGDSGSKDVEIPDSLDKELFCQLLDYGVGLSIHQKEMDVKAIMGHVKRKAQEISVS